MGKLEELKEKWENYHLRYRILQYDDIPWLIQKVEELSKELNVVLHYLIGITTSRKGSIETIDNVYLPQLDVKTLEIIIDNTQEALKDL